MCERAAAETNDEVSRAKVEVLVLQFTQNGMSIWSRKDRILFM